MPRGHCDHAAEHVLVERLGRRLRLRVAHLRHGLGLGLGIGLGIGLGCVSRTCATA